tara:strand:- start:124 stop:507 length:384 start_codon:yes stop_codon:yes gene_type:complete
MTTKSTGGNSYNESAGGTTLLGPNILNGEALLEKIGSVNIVFPLNRTSKVECPIHVTLGCSELKCIFGFCHGKPSFSKGSAVLSINFWKNERKSKKLLEFWLPFELWKDAETLSNCFELEYPLSSEK